MLPLLLSALISQAAALPREVPYLPQTEALCGGAAAAMVMRYWGATARPEDFAALIDPAQDGIVTTALVADLRARGWEAFPQRGGQDSTALRDHISRGRPIIALIEDRPSRYHYVVVTSISDARVGFHDPAVAPFQTMPRAEFERRWRAANFWMLLLLPGTGDVDGWAPPESEFVKRVAALLREGKAEEALLLSDEAAEANPASAEAWDAKATALFVMDRDRDALDAWNRAGKPEIDTVQIAGLRRTRFRAAEQLMGLERGELLTAADLARARRRLSLLPSSSGSRVGYAPRADGRVQIDAAIVERSRLPGAAELLVMAAKAPFSRDIELSFTNLVGGGERVTGAWRFREGFNRVEAAIDTPAPLPLGAVWRISGADARETYGIRGIETELRRQRAMFQASDWITSSIGWTAAAGYERWPAMEGDPHREKFAAALRGSMAFGSWADAQVTAEGWMHGDGATRLSGSVRARVPASGGTIALSTGAEGVHGRAPMFLWPGAGDGHIRAPLLRAHPLVGGGTINVDEGRLFGRRLVHGTVEYTKPLLRLGLVELAGALFTDAARAWQLLDGRVSDYQIDSGAGLRVRVLGGPTFRLDIARGLRDGRWGLSAGIW